MKTGETVDNLIPRIGRSISWLTFGAAIAALLLAQGGRLSPSLDVLAHLSGHFIGAALTAGIALWLGRYQVSILALGLVLTIAFPITLSRLAPQEFPTSSNVPGALAVSRGSGSQAFAASPAQQGNTETALKVISLNSWHSNKSPEKIVSYLKRVSADVVILIEFGPSKTQLLQSLKKHYPHQVHCAKHWYCSLALISRIPFVAAKSERPKKSNPPLIWARFALGKELSRQVTVIGTHIYRPSSKPTLHFENLASLAGFVKTLKGSKIVAGDFNMTPWSQSYRQFIADSGLQAAGGMHPSWPVWPLSHPQIAIDHLFTSQDLIVEARGLGPPVGSDHLPIWAVIASASEHR